MKHLVYILFAVVLYSCSSQPDLSDFQSDKDTLTMYMHQTCIHTTYNFTLRPDSVSNDSRCPPHANCFWEGDASVKFSLKLNETEHSFILHTSHVFTNDTTIDNVNFKLLELSSPYENSYQNELSRVKVVVTKSTN